MLVAQSLPPAQLAPSTPPPSATGPVSPPPHALGAANSGHSGEPLLTSAASGSCSGAICTPGAAAGADARSTQRSPRGSLGRGAAAHESQAAIEADGEVELAPPFLNVSIVNVPFRAESGGLDGGVLEEFFRERDVEAAREYFYVLDGRPHLCCWIEWRARPAPPPADKARTRGRRERAEDRLDTASRAAFEALREWRLARAKELSVPAYRLFADRVLTRIAQRRPADRSALSAIEGVGAAALERWADDVLAVLARLRTGGASAAAGPGSATSSPQASSPDGAVSVAAVSVGAATAAEPHSPG